jgi:hypothetical protein
VKVLKLFLRCPILLLAFKWKLWCGLTRWLACEWYLVLLSKRLVGNVRWGKVRQPAHTGQSKLLFPPHSSCVALQLQLCFVGSSPRQVGQFSFECCLLSQKSAPGFTPCPPLGGWPVVPPSLSAFAVLCTHHWKFGTKNSDPCPTPASSALRVWLLAPHLGVQHWEFSSCPTLVLPGRFSIPSLSLMLVLDYSSLFMFSVLLGGRVVQSVQELC